MVDPESGAEPSSAEESSVQRQLVHEHGQLDRALEELRCAAEGSHAADVRRAWDELERLLLRHLDFEEQQLFPQVEALHPEWTRGFRSDHAELRRRLAELGVRVDLHALRKGEVDEFVSTLRSHAEVEDRTVYRWAADAAPRDTRRHLLALLARTAAADLRAVREGR
jgi:hemerythrin-like domain-containing protein